MAGLERLEAVQQLPEVAYPGVYPLITLFRVSFILGYSLHTAHGH
jgi:hypothetical protein